MLAVTRSIALPAAPARVWETIADPGLFEAWMIGHAGFAHEPPAQLGPDTAFVQLGRMMGMSAKVKWRMAGWEPGRGFTLETKGPKGSRAQIGYRVEPVPGGSRLTASITFDGDIPVLMAGLARQETDKALAQALDKLHDLLASQAPTAGLAPIARAAVPVAGGMCPRLRRLLSPARPAQVALRTIGRAGTATARSVQAGLRRPRTGRRLPAPGRLRVIRY